MKPDKFTLTPTVAAVITFMSVMASAETKILRIADKGTGDGSSWEAPMGSISNALAKADQMVKAGECGHVELWIKKGRYYAAGEAKNTSETDLASEVTLRGGFAGTETSADQADPVANPTYITGDMRFDTVWQRNGSTAEEDRIGVWKDESTLRMPNPDHADKYWNTFRGSSGYNDVPCAFRYSGAVSNICFNGLTFVVYKECAIRPADASSTADDVLFTNCTFVACERCANLNGRRNRFADCSFFGNGAGLFFVRPAAAGSPKSAVVSNCLFAENRGVMLANRLDNNTLDSVNGGTLSVFNCTFRYNYVGSDTLYNLRAGNVACTNRLFDCQFVSNRVMATGNGLVSSVSSVYQSGSYVSLDRCQFIDNLATNVTVSAGLCLYDEGYSRRWILNSCVFSGNRDVSEKDNLSRSCVLRFIHAGTVAEFYNGTFVSNFVTASGAGSCASMMAVSAGLTSAEIGLFNCVCKDNALVCGMGGRAAEIDWQSPSTNCRCTSINTIFDNEVPGYRTYCFTGDAASTFMLVDVACYHPVDIDVTTCGNLPSNLIRWDYAITEKPVYSGYRTNSDGLVSFGVATLTKSVSTNTIAIVQSETGKYWAYDPKCRKQYPYFSLNNYYFSNGKNAETAKVTPDSPLLADAFGQPRKMGKVALGPLNAPNPGLMLLLR